MTITQRFRGPLRALLTAFAVGALAAPAMAGNAKVPDVVGLQVQQAKDLLSKAGFQMETQPVHGRRIGLVVSQEPGGLSTRATGTTVVLKVGAPTPKPGLPSATPPTTQPEEGDGALGAPPAGSGRTPVEVPGPAPATPAGSAALLLDGHAIPPGRLPDTNGPELPSVLGQPTARARAALRGWTVRVELTMAVPELVGKVVNQVPYAGSHLGRGEPATIIVGVARAPSPNHVFVPQAQGKPWMDGVQAARDGGLVPQPYSVASSAADRGRVLRQSPQPGSLAPRGSPLRLLVGRGPGAYESGGGAPAAPATPKATEPEPQPKTQPQPAEPTPANPADDTPPAGKGTSPIPEPQPTEPAQPAEPQPTQPQPAQPQPAQPQPAQPQPTEPQPTQPAAAPPAPSLTSPPAGESYPYKYGAEFSWTAVTGASGYEVELQEEQPSGAWNTVQTWTANGTRYRPAKIDRGRYRWRVRAVHDGTKGLWSEYRRLYMY